MVGEARLTAHGSAGAVLLGGAAADGSMARGAAEGAADAVVVACGVFATVESPEPHPVNVAANATADTADQWLGTAGSDHTSRTVPLSGPRVRQAWPRSRHAQTSRSDGYLRQCPPDSSPPRLPRDVCRPADPSRVLRAIADVGYESPTAIQAATIPALMAGSDVVGLAQTGTGKTAAFAIPILSKIDLTSNATQALVLAPTRELALQVAEAFSRYGAHLPQINVLPIYGGSVLRCATGRAETRGTGGGRHPRPGHRPPRTRHAGSVAGGLPGARRGRRDARHGLRRRRRAHPVRNPGIQTGGAVLGDHAAGRSARLTTKYLHDPARGRLKGENRYSREHFAALHPGGRVRARWTH